MTTTAHLPVWSHLTATLGYPDGRVEHEYFSTLDPNQVVYVHVGRGPNTLRLNDGGVSYGLFRAMLCDADRMGRVKKHLGFFRTRAGAMRAMEKRFGLPVCPNKAPGAARGSNTP